VHAMPSPRARRRGRAAHAARALADVRGAGDLRRTGHRVVPDLLRDPAAGAHQLRRARHALEALPDDLPLATLAGDPVRPFDVARPVADRRRRRRGVRRDLRAAICTCSASCARRWVRTRSAWTRSGSSPTAARRGRRCCGRSGKGQAATVLRVPREALARCCSPPRRTRLAEHFYIVDPMGQWMMPSP
jgi:hypothetical protein